MERAGSEAAELVALVGRAQGGEADAFGALVRRFQNLAVATAWARLGDAERARDAAQDAFIDAFLHLGQLREPAAFPGWLRRIVGKHCDRQTRRRALPAAPLGAERAAAAAPMPGRPSRRARRAPGCGGRSRRSRSPSAWPSRSTTWAASPRSASPRSSSFRSRP